MGQDDNNKKNQNLLKRPGRPTKHGSPMTAAKRKAEERLRMKSAGYKQRQIWIPSGVSPEQGSINEQDLLDAVNQKLEQLTALESTCGKIPLDNELSELIKAVVKPVLERRLKNAS